MGRGVSTLSDSGFVCVGFFLGFIFSVALAVGSRESKMVCDCFNSLSCWSAMMLELWVRKGRLNLYRTDKCLVHCVTASLNSAGFDLSANASLQSHLDKLIARNTGS